jgi:hypothetical protein
MTYLLAGVGLLAASIAGLWVSLPDADGKAKPFVAAGHDVWISVAITCVAVLGVSALVFGVADIVQ